MWDFSFLTLCLFVLIVYPIWNLLLYTLDYMNWTDYVIYYAKFGFYIVCSLTLSLFLLPVMVFNGRNVWNAYLIGQTSKHMTKVLGVTWELRNRNVLLNETGAVMIANHQSSLDFLCICNIVHAIKRLAVVCRKEVLYILHFGLALYLANVIFIDRKKPAEAHNILKTSAEVLLKNKTKICIFPEGTRHTTSDKMLPFKNGAFTLAITCQVPIIPVVISSYYFLDANKKVFRKGHVIVQCLDAVPTEGLTMEDLPQLKVRIQKTMEDTYKKLKSEIEASSELK